MNTSQCPFCEAEQEPGFQVCWSCCREQQTGRLMCNFEAEPALPIERSDQFDLKSLFLVTVAAAMVFQILALKPNSVETLIRFALFILGAGYLSLKLIVWIIFNLVAAGRSRIPSCANARDTGR